MARYFDRTNDTISATPSANFPTTGSFTFAGFIYWDGNSAAYRDFLDRGATNGWTLTIQQTTGKVEIVKQGIVELVFNYVPPTNVWTSIVIRHTVVTNVVLFAKRFDTGATYSETINNTQAMPAASATLRIGSNEVPINFFGGRLAEFMVFNSALSDAQCAILRDRSQGIPFVASGLVGYWPLWGVASPEPDLSGEAQHGTVTEAALADHPPFGRYAPFKHRWQPGGAVEYVNVTDSGLGTDIIVGIEEWLSITDTGLGTDSAYLLGEVLIDGLRLDHALRIRVSEPTVIASKPVSSGLPSRTYLGKQGRTLEIEGWVATVAELNTLSALADGAVHEVQLPTGSRVSVHIPDVNPVRPIEPGKYPYTIRAVERMD
jgi:hypothetical protein